ncbi:MAG: ATP-dependent protease ClpP protease subunit [Halieaceae bacterium]|jgi:ATP-dependent protease ClpP protease subunit
MGVKSPTTPDWLELSNLCRSDRVEGKTWFDMKAQGETLELSIYDEIGMWGVNGSDFKRALDGFDNVSEIVLNMHSPGGSVFDGLAIYNQLKNHKAKVTVKIDGLAASIASVIAMAGDTIIIPENAFIMIHKPRMPANGIADELRESADLLDKVETTLIAAYRVKTGLTDSDISEMLEAETWLTGIEAVEMGFADEIAEPIQAAATLNNGLIEEYSQMPSKAKTLISATPADKFKAAELARRTEVKAVFADFPQHDDVRNGCLDDMECSAETARAKLLATMGAAATPSAAAIHVGNGSIVRDVLQDALQARTGAATLQDKGNPYQASSLLDLARASLIQNGTGVATLAPMQVVAAAFTHSSGDFGSVLSNVAEKSLLNGWNSAPETYPLWTRKGTLSSFRPALRAGIGGYPVLPSVAEGAEYTHATMNDTGEVIALAKHGSMFSITREAIINDDLDAFYRIPAGQGRAAMRTIGSLVYACLTGNTVMSDGKGIFHADHGGNTIVDALDIGGIANMRRIMRMQTDNAGQSLNIAPGYLLVPAALESQAQQVIASTAVPGADSNSGIKNPVNSAAEIVVESRLDAASADSFYMVAGAGDTIEVAFLDGMDTPYLEQQAGWSVDGVSFKVRIEAGVAPIDYRGFVRGTGGLPV